jgi:hypothetical protein
MQPATTATDPESRPLTMLTQKPRFSTGKPAHDVLDHEAIVFQLMQQCTGSEWHVHQLRSPPCPNSGSS